MNHRGLLTSALLFALGSTACVPSHGEWLRDTVRVVEDDRQIVTRMGMTIPYGDDPDDFLDGWSTDNLYRSRWNRRGSNWRAKLTDAYLSEREFDSDGNGTYEMARRDLTYVLRLIHLESGGVIWIRTIPVSTLRGERDIDVILYNYGDNLSGYFSAAADVYGHARAITSARVEDNPALVDGYEAHAATFEFADTNRVRIAPDAREYRSRVIIARTPYRDSGRTNRGHHPSALAANHWRRSTGEGSSHSIEDMEDARDYVADTFPVLLVIGYSNRPERFEAGLTDLDALIKRIRIWPDEEARGEFAGIVPTGGGSQVAPIAPPPAPPGASQETPEGEASEESGSEESPEPSPEGPAAEQ